MDWEKLRKYWDSITPVEEKVIEQHFQAMLEGNSDYIDEDASREEVRHHYHTFKQAWVMARLFTDRGSS